MAVLLFYVATLAPTVTGEDSGEFITAAYFFGVPHPPGYPLWTMLCGIWMHVLPIGPIAWRANLFSAVCMAAAVVVLSATLQRMGFRRRVAQWTAAAVGVTNVVWSQSVITEVYTLHLLQIATLSWLIARWHRERRTQWLAWGALVVGLGMANHQLIGFVALGLGMWVFFLQPILIKNVALILRCVLLFAVGLTPYFYLLWAGGRDVPVKWGETDSIATVWEHVSRGQYKSDHPIEAQVPMTAALLAGRLYYGLRWEVEQFTPFLVPIFVAGLIWLWRRRGRRALFWWVLLLAVCSGPLFLYVSGPRLDRQDEFVQKVFLTPLALISAVPLAAGLHWLLAASRKMRGRGGDVARKLLRGPALAGVLAIPLIAHWHENNMRCYWYAVDHAQNLLACLRPGAIIFPSGDHNTFPLLYLIYVEGVRPDVTVADKYGYIDLNLYRDMPNNPGKPRTPEDRDDIERWIIRTAHRPVYYTVKKPALVPEAQMVPVGLVYHLLPKGHELAAQDCWPAIHYRNLEGQPAPEDLAAMNIMADYHYARGMTALWRHQPDEARRCFDDCLHHAWGMKEIYNNVASALAEFDQLEEAIDDYEEAAKMDWTYAPARWNLAKIFKSVGKFDWSAKVFEDLTRATPGDFRPFGELGFLCRDHFGDFERARYWWMESLRRNPDQKQIILALADVPQRPSRPSEATSRPTAEPAPTTRSDEASIPFEEYP